MPQSRETDGVVRIPLREAEVDFRGASPEDAIGSGSTPVGFLYGSRVRILSANCWLADNDF